MNLAAVKTKAELFIRGFLTTRSDFFGAPLSSLVYKEGCVTETSLLYVEGVWSMCKLNP